ncbi:Kinase superfamily protein [Rhynchospora pubera]|uniref:Kinase superfamily protein n=1 Tax=Rhynchospora pubera TaxID=906938 RepID=A0AAV8GDP2_9POAL|nr:Kinase superfamily protein [Rhynchospora pubera]
MNLFCCFSSSNTNATRNAAGPAAESTEESPPTVTSAQPSSLESTRTTDTVPRPKNVAGNSSSQAPNTVPNINNIPTQIFTFQELGAATKKFRKDHLIGEGHYGKVYKGILGKNGRDVAIKELNLRGVQEKNKFLVEVLTLSKIRHANVLNLVGYCADDNHRLLVCEQTPRGSLDKYLFDLAWQHPLDWSTRMRIANDAALGLEYLHNKFNPPLTYRKLRTSSILLDENFNPKLSAFGLSNLAAPVIDTDGNCVPSCAASAQWRVEEDVFNFGVILLELISGRRSIDRSKPSYDQQHIVDWARPMLGDKRRHPELIDPLLKDDYPSLALNRAVDVAAMCLLQNASCRPLMIDVVLSFTAVMAAGGEEITLFR